MTAKIRVGVLFGGQSSEHEVSLVSARAVLQSLDPAKYDVVPIGITKDGRWIGGGDPLAALTAAADPAKLPGGPAAPNDPEALTTLARYAEFAPLTAGSSLDVIFPVLHGPMGEDGTVQGLLELAGVPYVGCGVLASGVGMDKGMMKAAFAAAGLPLVPWQLVRRVDWQRHEATTIAAIEAQLQYPLFVKPANLGSSVGISKVSGRAALREALALAAGYDRRLIIEQGINAREIEVSVLGNDDPQASIPGEIIPSKEWYDYEAKYLSGASQIVIPASLPAELTELVQHYAIRAFAAIDGSGLARVDFLLDRNDGTLYLNEINTMPGFTPVSMYAQMWQASGMSYAQLVDRLIALALEGR
ncbi:MAG TPA: D-alanine--D-alanine ligase family protein [Roseiflexaceae bacterium]|nr:D-alanine--D-alanine ligase family protein [Roseiflexaceae bacterium]